jgi:hypothetical protein
MAIPMMSGCPISRRGLCARLGRRAAGFQLEPAADGDDGLSVGFAIRLRSSPSRPLSTVHRNSRSLSAGRLRRNISAANTTAFKTSQPPTQILKPVMAFLLGRISARFCYFFRSAGCGETDDDSIVPSTEQAKSVFSRT